MSSACRCSSTIRPQGDVRFGSCCTLDDLYDARRVARSIGIPHYIVNFERRFEEHVVADFVREYAAGRTPIPCVHCNGDLKFASLVERARGLRRHSGGDRALRARRARPGIRSVTAFFAASIAPKDQSYFLFTLSQAQLARAQFPVGDLDKSAVREEARQLGLAVAEKQDSQEICFVAAGEHAEFVARRSDALHNGLIRDRDGRVLGEHDGVHRFTIGQRKGLGLSSPVPLYVVEIDARDGRRHGRPARGAGAHDPDGLARELDRRGAHRRHPSAPP